jgi:Chemotaxis phosphatase CheX
MILNPADHARHLQLGLEEVLERMFYLSPDGEAALPAAISEPWLAAQLRFTGPVTGQLGLAVQPATAARLANNFLGQDCGERPAAQLADILGELVNMVAGSLLARSARCPAFDLSPPQPHPLTGCSTDFRPCSPPGLPAGPETGLLACSQACPMACLSWPEIRRTHLIVRAYGFEGQLFLAWLQCDPNRDHAPDCDPDCAPDCDPDCDGGPDCDPEGSSRPGALPSRNAPGFR